MKEKRERKKESFIENICVCKCVSVSLCVCVYMNVCEWFLTFFAFFSLFFRTLKGRFSLFLFSFVVF